MIAVNTAMILGTKLAGLWGAVLAVLGSILPPFLIILVIASFFSPISPTCRSSKGFSWSQSRRNGYSREFISTTYKEKCQEISDPRDNRSRYGSHSSAELLLDLDTAHKLGLCVFHRQGAQKMIFLELFWAFFQIGFLAFGGGYGALSLIQDQIVNVNKWLELPEFLDLISISQMTPGPIAINSATFIGYRIAGLGGSIISTIASCFRVFSGSS